MEYVETLGSQVLPLISFTACHRPYSGSLIGACTLCFPVSIGLLPKYRGSAYIPALQVYPSIGLPQLCPSDHILRGCTIRLTLRPAVLAGTPDWVKPAYPASRLGTVSGQVQPACYHANPPSAYISIRAIDMITSSQVKR